MNNIHYISKTKKDIIGFWQDGNKIYKDYIIKKSFNTNGELQYHKNILFKIGELAVFYTLGNKAIIEDKKGNITQLNNKKEYITKSLKKDMIKGLIEKYGGCTIYREKGQYKIEIWSI